MEQIIARQNSKAKPATGKTFVLGIARIILELAIVQAIVNFLIRQTGIGLLNLLFYLYAVVLLIRFMTRTVTGCIYTLKKETIELQRMMGDSTVLGVQIKCSDILSVRPIVFGERLELDYRQVTVVDPTCAPGLRMRAAFVTSLIWAWLARAIAGKKARKANGYVIAYQDGGKRCACVFKPDEAFLSALETALPDVFGVDERLERHMLETYYAKSLRRAFGDLYPHVPDAVTQEELAFEREEFARRKEERMEKRAKKKKIPLKEYKAQAIKRERQKTAARKKIRGFMRTAQGQIPFFAKAKEDLSSFAEKVRREEEEDKLPLDEPEEAPQRRRGRRE